MTTPAENILMTLPTDDKGRYYHNDLVHALNAALSTANVPTWTTEKPTEPGWYWWRYDYTIHHVEISHIIVHDGLVEELDRFGNTHILVDDGEWARVPEPREES